MIKLIFKMRVNWLKHNPIKFVGYTFLLIFIVFNLYIYQFLKDEPAFSDININSYLSILPLIIVLLSDFVPKYKFNFILLPIIYPVSNLKNSGIALFNEFFSFKYVIILVIFLALFFIYGFSVTILVEMIALVINTTILIYFIHYLVHKIKLKSIILFIASSLIFLVHIYFFLLGRNSLTLQAFLLFVQIAVYISQFKYFRYDYSINYLKPKLKSSNQNIWVIFYGFRTYKNLYILYFIVKIAFILVFCIYYHITNKIFISPIAFFAVLSPMFLFTYFHNNFFVLYNRINKNLFFAYNISQFFIASLLIIFVTSLVDIILSFPALVLFGWHYTTSYLILYFSYTLSSLFISLYFPKEKIASEFMFKSLTSSVGTILFFFYIAFVAAPSFRIVVKIIPIIISVVLFTITAVHFKKKLISIFENF